LRYVICILDPVTQGISKLLMMPRKPPQAPNPWSSSQFLGLLWLIPKLELEHSQKAVWIKSVHQI